MKTLKQTHQIRAMVTDDLATYKEISQEPEIGHQVRQFHVRRWVSQALKRFEEELPKEWLHVLPALQQVIYELPVNGRLLS